MVLKLNSVSPTNKYLFLLVPLSSVFYFLSLPPFSVSPLYLVSFIIIFYHYLSNKNFKLKFLYIFFFLNYFLSLIWISKSFQTGGIFYTLLGFMMVFLLANLLALLNIIVIGFLNAIIKKINLKIIFIPLSLTLVAIMKEFIMGGFPWNPSSIIWVNNLFIIKIIQNIGIYGFGIITHLIIAFGIYILFHKNKITIFLLTIFVCGLYGLQFLPINNHDKKNLNEDSDSLSILIIQPNIKDSLNDFSSLENLKIYEKHTRIGLKKFPKTDLIIWPEGSLSIDLNNRKVILKRIGNLLLGHQKIILGANAIEDYKLFNRMYLIGNNGDVEQYYDKQKLVLFGEYLPFKLSGISKFLNIGLSFSKGERDNIINLPKNFLVSPVICFESIFDSSLIKNNFCKTDFIIQISNDSWFGDYFGPIQHFKNSLLRSVEQKKILVRATPSGISAVISHNGEIIKAINNNKSGVISYKIFKSSFNKECKPFLMMTIMLLLLMYILGISYDRIRR
ncbi:apolipoprotein N-acyltransferase [Alphaproteobacteria bacterium]|nr:apolipoprotein N-acyltransferase [Alphaproteobacteria bacterium]